MKPRGERCSSAAACAQQQHDNHHRAHRHRPAAARAAIEGSLVPRRLILQRSVTKSIALDAISPRCAPAFLVAHMHAVLPEIECLAAPQPSPCLAGSGLPTYVGRRLLNRCARSSGGNVVGEEVAAIYARKREGSSAWHTVPRLDVAPALSRMVRQHRDKGPQVRHGWGRDDASDLGSRCLIPQHRAPADAAVGW